MLSSNIGISIVIFLAIAIVLITILCLITKYFNKKLEKALNDDNEVYSMIEEIKGSADGEEYEEYTQHIHRREGLEKSSSKKHEPFEIEMDEVRQPLGQPEDIYGTSKLKRRLEGGEMSVQVTSPLSKRSTGSIRSFRAERLDSERVSNSNRLRLSTNDEDIEVSGRTSIMRSHRDKKKSNFVTYTFINKIVAYNGEGIFIVENKVVSLMKTEEKIEEKKSIATLVVRPEQESFEDTLEVHGFEKNIYSAYKYEVTVEIPHMKVNEKYPVASLKCSESKSELEFPEFYHIKSTLESD